MTFEQWWVERFGRPPLAEDRERFEDCLDAFKAGGGEVEPLKIEEKKDQLQEMAEECILYDGYDDALIGVCHRFGREPIAIYDMDKCLETLMDEGIDYETASDHFWTNTMGAWNGDYTPAFLKRFQ